MKKITFLLMFLAIIVVAFGQTTIVNQGFETDLSGYSHTPSQTPATDPGDQYFYRAEPSDPAIYESGTDGPYTNVTGSWLFVGSNPNTFNGGSPGVLTLDPITVTGYTNLEFHADFGACDNDWDASDELSVEYNFDGGSWNTLYYFVSSGTNLPLSLAGNATGGINTTNGTVLTYALTTISSDNFTGSGSTLNIRIVQDAGSNYEAFGVDNIEIKGVVAGGVDNPSGFAAAVNGTDQIDLSWVLNGDNDDVMLAWSSDGTFGTPAGSYTAGDPITGGGTVLYNGSGTSYNHLSLTPNTQYFYKAWSVDVTPEYSPGVTDDATTLQVEPTNHVASFAAGTPTSNTIPLTWLDNDGATPADGFIIKASTSSTFTNPTDGIPEVDDTDMSDGSGQINVAHGAEAYDFSGLNLSTTYYFKIWPYTNSGSNIDYKTDGTVPTDNESTTGPPTTTLPYNEAFGADLGDCYTYSVSGATKEWHWESGGYAAMNGYNSGDIEEDWLVIPGIDLDSYSNEYMTFDTWYQYGTDGSDDYLKLMYSTNYSGTGDPSTATWAELSYTQPSSATTWTASGTVDLSTIPGTSVHIAYKYHYNPGDPVVYRSWRVDNILIQESSVDPQPSNYPTVFTATTNSSSAITNDWLDATGTQLPAGYLILANLDGNFTAPEDGTPVADDTDMSDGEGAINVAFGTETYQWTGLTQSTPYFFTIYPYTNTASAIDYKTDATAPTATATTDASGNEPALGDLYITEVNSTVPANATYIEIYNTTASTISLDKVDLEHYNNGAATASAILNLSGSIAANSYIVISRTITDFNTVYGFNSDFGFADMYLNGGTDGVLLRHNDNGILDQFNDVPSAAYSWSDNNLFYRFDYTADGSSIPDDWDDAGDSRNGTPKAKNELTWLTTTGDTDWSTRTNWSNGDEPSKAVDVIIPSGTDQPVADGTVANPEQCYNLTIQTGAVVTVMVDGFLTVNGNLTNNAGDGGVLIQSSSTDNGSLIVEGTVTGNATVQRYFEGYSEVGSDNGWHNISSPVDNMTISGSNFDPTGTSDDLYQWNESSEEWENYKQSHFTNFVNGKGYLCAFETSGTKNFVGTLNTSGFTMTGLTKDVDGFNLLGNPYASALVWNNVGWTLDNVGAVAQIWDEVNANYAPIAADGIIPSTNGFFVEVATVAGGSVTIPASARTHDATNNYKNVVVSTNEETLDLRLTNDENMYYDVCRVGFKDNATEAWDIEYDAHKLFGGSGTSQLWSVMGDENFVFNYLPYVYESYQLPIYFRAGVDATHHINVEGLESFYNNSEIYLEDLFTEKLINLSEQQNYTFIATTEDDEARFVIHFYGVTSTGDSPIEENGKIYTYQNTVYMKFNELPTDTYQVEVINMVGQQVYANEFAPAGLNSFKLNQKPGVYFVRLRAENKTMVQKVMISK